MLVKNDLQAIDKIVANRIQKDVPGIIQASVPVIVRKEIKPIIKRLDAMDKFLDRELTHAQRRVKRIEEHLGLQAPSAV